MISSRTIQTFQLDPQRHRFHNKVALYLTVATLLLLTTLSIVFGKFDDDGEVESSRWLEEAADDDGNGNGNYAKYSCRYIYDKVPNAGYEQCRFARTCNDGQGLWAPFVFCHYNKSRAITLFLIISPVIIVWMVTLFRLLGSTAEDYFSPSLEMFSVKLGLPPRFAGVSLLALGNGAADVSATMSAIVNDVDNGYKLSLGALTGAAMLVGGLVAGLVVLVADGVPCRGALVRDVTALFVTVCVVWAHLSTGKVGPGTTTLFLSMYGLFVAIVLVADIYHRAVVLPRIRALQARIAATGSIDDDGILQPDIAADPGPPAVLTRVMTALSNYDNVPPGAAPPVEETAEWGITSETAPNVQQQAASLQESDAPIILHGQHGLLSPPRHHGHLEASTASPAEVDGGGAYELVQDQVDQLCVAPGSLGFGAVNWSGAMHDGKQEIMAAFSEAWEDIAYNGDLNVAEKAMMICEFPFTVLRKVTVPIPCDGYYNRGLVALSVALCPLWFAYYIWVGHEINLVSKQSIVYFLITWGLAVVVALAVLRYAPGGEGSMAMAAATPIALVGFIIAATWIDYVADHLVSLLDFVGIILHIPGSIMGLTVLAWGNSMGDLSANLTMARKGLANMAMTACFAGPVFNILMGLGLGFGGLASKTGIPIADVTISAPAVTGFVFVLLNCIMILTTGVILCKGKIETHYGYFALGLYTTYVIVSISLEFSKYGGN